MKKIWLMAAVVVAVALTAGLAAQADWGDPIKWSQNELDEWAVASFIDPDTDGDAISADDFPCTETGYITDIHFWGFCQSGSQYIDKFRVGFWSDVPASPNDASHPGDLLWQKDFGKADPSDPLGLGWKEPTTNEFRINIPRADWFVQQGTPGAVAIYWISIQGVMVADGYEDFFYWQFRNHERPTWNDDAAIASTYWAIAPWYNWGLDPGSEEPEPQTYEWTLPEGWTSLDMAFELSGRPIPEPSSLMALACGLGSLCGVVLRRRGR